MVGLCAKALDGLQVELSKRGQMSIEEAIQAKEELLRTFADAANAFTRETGLTVTEIRFDSFSRCGSASRYVFDVIVTL